MRPIGLAPRTPRACLTPRSDLRRMVLRMISTNSLAAFTAEVSRMQGPVQARAASTSPSPGGAGQTDPIRRLETLPPMPAGPLPRGSLLDLKV
jgi:hypothetical protein